MSHQDIELNRAFLDDLLTRGAGWWDEVNFDYGFRQELDAACDRLVRRAFAGGDRRALHQLHDVLAAIHDQDFRAASIERVACETQPILRDIAAKLERATLGEELKAVPAALLASRPERPREYVPWLTGVIGDHPAASHPFYATTLAKTATREDMRFYLAQETNLDPRFDDILALVQIGTAGEEKMEIAANFWDEMGNGEEDEVHTALFAESLRALDVGPAYIAEHLLLEAKVSASLSSCLALSRRHYYKAIGFFGVTEYLVPRRFTAFLEGWRRLGLPMEAVKYHDLHVRIDAVHASGWFRNVIAPLVERDPRVGDEIALGALIRLQSSQRYLDALLGEVTRRAEGRPSPR
ncbi:MAG: iron-containing redox enzyme family protein [Nannocystaceae bacterium]